MRRSTNTILSFQSTLHPNAVFYATEAEGESIGLNEKGFFKVIGINIVP
jgi:hypothetical protein